jgi:hypothetical protein
VKALYKSGINPGGTMARGKKNKSRKRAKRFEHEFIQAASQICEELNLTLNEAEPQFQNIKHCIGKMVKRLLDNKLLREQEFYPGDWICTVAEPDVEPMEILEVNYKLKTARIKDPSEGEIWVKFADIVKDEDFLLF